MDKISVKKKTMYDINNKRNMPIHTKSRTSPQTLSLFPAVQSELCGDVFCQHSTTIHNFNLSFDAGAFCLHLWGHLVC